jgi:hypothetical protein
VAEPFESLWLEDVPVGYRPGHGPMVRPHMFYHQAHIRILDCQYHIVRD